MLDDQGCWCKKVFTIYTSLSLLRLMHFLFFIYYSLKSVRTLVSCHVDNIGDCTLIMHMLSTLRILHIIWHMVSTIFQTPNRSYLLIVEDMCLVVMLISQFFLETFQMHLRGLYIQALLVCMEMLLHPSDNRKCFHIDHTL